MSNGDWKWYDEHTRVIAFGVIFAALTLLSPVFMYLFSRAEANERAISEFRLEVRDNYTPYEMYCRDMEKLTAKIDAIHDDIEKHMRGGN